MPAGRIVHRRVDRSVGCRGHRGIARRLREIANDRVGAAQLHLGGLLPVAHEGVDVMPGAQQGVEYCRTDVPGSAGQKNSHMYCRPLQERNW